METEDTDGKTAFLEALKEMRLLRAKRNKRIRSILLTIEYITFFTGIVLVGYHNFWIAIGIFLMIFSNNMGVFRMIGKKGIKIYENIWKE
jgi:hypothetical protein